MARSASGEVGALAPHLGALVTPQGAPAAPVYVRRSSWHNPCRSTCPHFFCLTHGVQCTLPAVYLLQKTAKTAGRRAAEMTRSLPAQGSAVREARVGTEIKGGLVLRAGNPSEAAIRDWCVAYLARTLDLTGQTIDTEVTFARLGLDSANSVFLIVELEDWLGLELTPDLLFEHPTIGELARHLATRAADERN